MDADGESAEIVILEGDIVNEPDDDHEESATAIARMILESAGEFFFADAFHFGGGFASATVTIVGDIDTDREDTFFVLRHVEVKDINITRATSVFDGVIDELIGDERTPTIPRRGDVMLLEKVRNGISDDF